MRLGFGIVGMGKMAENHAKWIMARDEMRLVTICDRRPERHAKLRETYGADIYVDYDDLIGRKDVDVVVVSTTNEVHEDLTVRALNAGKHVVVEKPMALNYESAKRMVQAAKRNKREVIVHLSSRWDREFLAIRQILGSGVLGDLLSIQARVMMCDEFWPSWGIHGMENPWRIKAQYGGGILYDWGPHLVDQVLLLVGKAPIGVFGILQSGVWTTEVDDHFLAVLRFDGQQICQIEVSNNGRINTPRWYITCTKGTLAVPGKTSPFWDEVEMNYLTANGKKEIRKIQFVNVTESGMEGGFYDELVPYLKGQKKDFVTMNDGLRSVKILDLIMMSDKEKRYIPYDAIAD
jgi:scyllo-inositol 2-dehydrogenase (NADP+)